MKLLGVDLMWRQDVVKRLTKSFDSITVCSTVKWNLTVKSTFNLVEKQLRDPVNDSKKACRRCLNHRTMGLYMYAPACWTAVLPADDLRLCRMCFHKIYSERLFFKSQLRNSSVLHASVKSANQSPTDLRKRKRGYVEEFDDGMRVNPINARNLVTMSKKAKLCFMNKHHDTLLEMYGTQVIKEILSPDSPFLAYNNGHLILMCTILPPQGTPFLMPVVDSMVFSAPQPLGPWNVY
jgi:hypothetical protein